MPSLKSKPGHKTKKQGVFASQGICFHQRAREFLLSGRADKQKVAG
jgi:hypothetical protein